MDDETLTAKVIGALLARFGRQAGGQPEGGEPEGSETGGDVTDGLHAVVQRYLADNKLDNFLAGLGRQPDDPILRQSVQGALLKILREDLGFGTELRREIETVDAAEAAALASGDEVADTVTSTQTSTATGNHVTVGNMRGHSQFALGNIVNNRRVRISLGLGLPILLLLLLLWFVVGRSDGDDDETVDAGGRSVTSDNPADGDEDDDEQAGDRDDSPGREPSPTTSTTVDAGGVIADDVLPLVTCDTSDPLTYLASIQVLEAQTGELFDVFDGLPGICNGNADLTHSFLTGSGRYLVTLWESPAFSDPSLNVVDVTTGTQVEITQAQLDAWATSQTGTGLDAAEQSLTITGFDRNDDGRMFFFLGSDWEDDLPSPSSPPLAYLSQDVADLIESGGTLSPAAEPGEHWCYTSMYWSPDGGHCLIYDGSGGDYFVPTAAGPIRTEEPYVDITTPYDDSVGSYRGCGFAEWSSSTTVVGVECGGKSVYLSTIGGGDAELLYEITGDRYLQPLVISATGTVYILSPTLDATATEVYLLSSTPGGEPTLMTTLPQHTNALSN